MPARPDYRSQALGHYTVVLGFLLLSSLHIAESSEVMVSNAASWLAAMHDPQVNSVILTGIRLNVLVLRLPRSSLDPVLQHT